jgi:hypothetical protein
MTKILGGGKKTPRQGAQTVVKLAIKDIGGASGAFWEEEEQSTW